MNTILGSQLKDNFFIVYSVFAGFFLLGLYVFLLDYLQLAYMHAGLILILLYSVFFDVNHFFPTYSRVFLDKAYFSRNKGWLIYSLIFIVAAPLIISWIFSTGERERFLFMVFFRRFVLVLGFYHLVKQNWGFMAIYKKQAGEKKTKINWDLLALLSGSFIALLLMSIKDPIWFPGTETILFSPQPNQKEYIVSFWYKLTYLCLGMAIFFAMIALFVKQTQVRDPAKSLAMYCVVVAGMIVSTLKFGAETTLTVTLFAIVALFFLSLAQAIRYQLQEPRLNINKWAVFIASLLLYFGVFLFPLEGDKLIVVAAITLPHNIQYLAFVPHFSRKQYASTKHDHGYAKKLVDKLGGLFIVGLVFAVVFEVGRTGSAFLLPESWRVTKVMVSMFFLSLLLHHYYLDAVIWRRIPVSKSN